MTPPPPPRPPSRSGLDYLLAAGTGLLFVVYIPVFIAAPKWALLRLGVPDLLWILPLFMMSSCLVALIRWALFGATNLGRVLWCLAFILAVFGCPAAYFCLMMIP